MICVTKALAVPSRDRWKAPAVVGKLVEKGEAGHKSIALGIHRDSIPGRRRFRPST